jgi:hypothetical protein
MISAKQNLEALQGWALDELRQLGNRNFELAKFFFGISAGSFAIIPFFGLSISISNIAQTGALFMLGLSTVFAILMANPAKFVVDDKLDLVTEHRKFAKKLELLKYGWMVSWIAGVALIFVAANGASTTLSTTNDATMMDSEQDG